MNDLLNGDTIIAISPDATHLYSITDTHGFLSYVQVIPKNPEIPKIPDVTPCFLHDSILLTYNPSTKTEEYKSIQLLQKGDLVKTRLHGFIPITHIGKKSVYHPAKKDMRIEDQLYICFPEDFPELTTSLVITGRHCILVPKFETDEQIENVKRVNGQIYLTEKRYRLPACLHSKTHVYEKEGIVDIYHIALEL